MQEALLIRAAKKSDIKQLQTIILSLRHCFLSDSDNFPEWFANTLTESAFEQRFDNPSFQHFIYTIKGEIVAYIAMNGRNKLYHLFVIQALQNKGIARQLWLHAKERNPADFYIVHASLNAVPFYKKCGFVESAAMQNKQGLCYQPMQAPPPNNSVEQN